MEIKIESNIPIPEKGKTRENNLTELMRKMKIGDSFVIEGHASSFHTLAKSAQIKITTRKVKTQDGSRQFRVWRTE